MIFNSILSMFTENTSVLEKSDSEISDDLAKLNHSRPNYECGGAKTPCCLIKMGGRELRLYAFHFPSVLTARNHHQRRYRSLIYVKNSCCVNKT